MCTGPVYWGEDGEGSDNLQQTLCRQTLCVQALCRPCVPALCTGERVGRGSDQQQAIFQQRPCVSEEGGGALATEDLQRDMATDSSVGLKYAENGAAVTPCHSVINLYARSDLRATD